MSGTPKCSRAVATMRFAPVLSVMSATTPAARQPAARIASTDDATASAWRPERTTSAPLSRERFGNALAAAAAAAGHHRHLADQTQVHARSPLEHQ
jgi:hypothetical protein